MRIKIHIVSLNIDFFFSTKIFNLEEYKKETDFFFWENKKYRAVFITFLTSHVQVVFFNMEFMNSSNGFLI